MMQRQLILFCILGFNFSALIFEGHAAPLPRFGGELRQAIYQPIKTLSPASYLNFAELQIASNLYEGLVRQDRFGKIVSGIAQRWSHTDDYRIWQFALSPHARFHNGQRVTANDVRNSWERTLRGDGWILVENPLLQLEGADAYRNGRDNEIEGFEAVSEDELRIALQVGDSDFLRKLTSPAAYVTLQGEIQPFGTGRFRLAAYSPTEVRLAANGDYPWGRPYLEGMTFRYYAESREAQLDFEAGLLDVLPLSYTEVEQRRESPTQSLVQTDAAAVVYLKINPPSWNAIVGYATDTNALLRLQYGATISDFGFRRVLPLRHEAAGVHTERRKAAYNGSYAPRSAWEIEGVESLALRSDFGMKDTIHNPQSEYDPTKARRRAKHMAHRNLDLAYAPLPDNTGHTIAARLARDSLSPIGLQVTVKPLDQRTFDAADTIWLLSTPMPPGGATALVWGYFNGVVPLYALPVSFLCRSNLRDVQVGWGGGLLFGNAWLAK